MIIRNSVDIDILASVTRFGIMQIDRLDGSGEYVPLTDEKRLYEELLTHILEEMKSKGYQITNGDFDCEPIDQLFVETAPCEQLGGGCTCEQCTAMIADAIGWDSVETSVE